jgi:hypothetical protein
LKRTPANIAYIAKVKTYNADVKEHNNRERQRVQQRAVDARVRVQQSEADTPARARARAYQHAGGVAWNGYGEKPRANAAIGY